ncbi:MAG: CRTAC1 family protein, partial [Planctomycetota bacterium]
GGTVADFNRDGYQDIFALDGGLGRDRLFINNGDGTFTDEATAWGLTAVHMGGGAAAGDFNGDGWIDLFVTSFGTAGGSEIGVHHLYRNNGDGTFTDIAQSAGVALTNPDIADGFGATFGDYDLDGDLDLVVAGWMGHDGTYTGQTRGNRLFRNNGDETFDDVTAAAGLSDLNVHGLSPRFVDMDGDRFPELLLAADFETSRYYRNNRDGTFTDITAASQTGLDRNGMGAAIGDFDNDARLDWYVTAIYNVQLQFPGNMLYRNEGGNVFSEVSEAWGVSDGGWGWGAEAVDFDHDGLLDLIATNGWVYGNYQWDATRVWRNQGTGAFREVAVSVGVSHIGQGRGLVCADFDNDGDQDLVIFCNREPLVYYRNDLSGPGTNWLRIFLDTRGVPDLAPDGFGARVEILAGGVQQVRVICPGATYLGGSEFSAHFGLGSATTAQRVRVIWPNGAQTTLTDVSANKTLTIRPRWGAPRAEGVHAGAP